MTTLEAIYKRHSVRSYLDKPVPEDIKSKIEKEIIEINEKADLNLSVVWDNPKVFSNFLTHYGKFKGVKNYFILAGKKCKNLSEKLGYYGEKLAITSQALGLNTCWVALNYSKTSAKRFANLKKDDKVVCVIALGYGKTQGVPHHNKNINSLFKAEGDIPDWFKNGLESATYAPTALNQQRWKLILKGEKVEIKALFGPYSKVDSGIVKYHFEVGSGKDSTIWVGNN